MDAATLIDSQRELQVRISRSIEYLKKMGAPNITSNAVATRIRLLDQAWQKFESQHDLVRAALKDKFKDSEYNTSGLHDLTENAYVQQRSVLDGYAERLRSDAEAVRLNEAAPRTALPRVKIPSFSGAYSEWPTFRDLFTSIVGENASTSNIERLHHLRSSLQGQAEKLISTLPVTGENYERAWAILCKHYKNKKELIRSNFAAFTAVPKMKAKTAEELGRIYTAVTTVVNAQENIRRPIESHGMDLLNYQVVELFDARTRMEWESSTSTSSEAPQHATLMDFINRRMLTLNAAKPKASTKHAGEMTRGAKSHVAKQGFGTQQCLLCQDKHPLMTCRSFKAKSAVDRKTFVETNKLCFNCLGNHFLSQCQSKKNCFTCKARHHTTLHEAYTQSAASEATSLVTTLHDTRTQLSQPEVASLNTTRTTDERKAVLLATARVSVADHHGSLHAVRVLIDQGSEVSLVSEKLVQRLRLPRSHTDMAIFGIGGSRPGSTRGKVTLHLTSSVTDVKLVIEAFVLPRLSLQFNSAADCPRTWPHIHGLQLADPRFFEADSSEVLLGAEICSLILQEGLRKGSAQMPIAQRTSLGWILSGGSHGALAEKPRRTLRCTTDRDLTDLVQRFWEQEREPTITTTLTLDEQRCEDFYVQTHTRTASGRYVVRLPFSSPPANLQETRRPAERLLTAMERRSSQDPRFGELYRDFMREYEDLQHMEVVNSPSAELGSRCYLPHHGVIKESSTSTKLRVVFNGSQRNRVGESLNTHLHTGANLLPALPDVLLRWRQHRHAFVTDIEKMYRQIRVQPDDCAFQTILWRHDNDDEVREYRLRTVTYGLACAPFLAIRTLRQLAADEEKKFPRGVVALRRDCYVDDVVTGADTLE